MVLWLNFFGVVLALVQVRFSGYAASFWWLPRVLGSNAAVNADGFAAGYFGSLAPLKPSFIWPMLFQTAFSFSSVIQRWVCRFSGLRLHFLRQFHFLSAALPRWRSAFSQLAPVAKFRLSVLASGSNISVKPTRILRSAYLAR